MFKFALLTICVLVEYISALIFKSSLEHLPIALLHSIPKPNFDIFKNCRRLEPGSRGILKSLLEEEYRRRSSVRVDKATCVYVPFRGRTVHSLAQIGRGLYI
ncbi:unnamed protein product [Pieris brassicae]|uniref:Secreted protein n=1 Tax=Pieris brassicae TaxID=7116 RepID=A0A9P0SWW2_PIEBR|nr:unnamed protein product [Pieris brassicae]